MSYPLYKSALHQRRRILRVMLWAVLLATTTLGIENLRYESAYSVGALFAFAAVCAGLLLLLQRGYVAVPAGILLAMGLLVINISLIDGDGILDPGTLAYPIFIMGGALFFGRRTAWTFFLAALLSMAMVLQLQIIGVVEPTIGAGKYADLIPFAVLLFIATVVVAVMVRSIEGSLQAAQTAADELRESYDQTLEAWAKALEYRHRETEGHSRRVIELSTRLARQLGLGEEEIAHLRRGALVHDIGKLAIPDGILQKPGELNEEERAVIRQHPLLAREILSGIAFMEPALSVAVSHHEHWDGTGYPEGRAGEEIPLLARIFSVVDAWDALHSDRAYRKAWPPERVIEYLKENAGRRFDPKVVEVFLTLV